MKTIALVAPFFQDNTLRYVRALADVGKCQALLISQDPRERLPADLQDKIAGHYRVGNCMNGDDLARACRAFRKHFGELDGLYGVLEQLQEPMAQARELADVPGMGSLIAKNFRDKAQMKDVLRAAGVPVARHMLVERDLDALDFVEKVGLPIILKPVAGLGSRGTYRIQTIEDLHQALKTLRPSIDAPLQAEEFVVGRENTCETVTIAGKHVWSSGTWYMNRPLEVLENPWMQYCVILPREDNLPEFKKFLPDNHAALTALGMQTGLSHMEWFLRADGTHVVSEVGARPPGVQIMPMNGIAYEVDMLALWTKLMVHEEWPKKLTRKWAVGAAFFRGQGRGRKVAHVAGLDQAMITAVPYLVDANWPTVGKARADGYEGEGWVIVKANDTATVKDVLRQLVTLVQIRYA